MSVSFIVVDQDGNMKLNDKSVTFATLKEELQAKRTTAGQYYDDCHPIATGSTPHGHDRPDHVCRPPSRARRYGRL